MAVQGSATTHQSRHSGHGQTIPRRKFATPMGTPRGVVRGNVAPWYLTRRHLARPRPQYATQQQPAAVPQAA
jgi:hypothetical protein